MRGILTLVARACAFAAALLAAALLAIVLRTDPAPLSNAEILALVEGLNEAAAIGVPHGFLASAGVAKTHGALLRAVESGAQLDAAASAAYRRAYQRILFENQAFLARFDSGLSVLTDVEPQATNNCLGLGIAGRHDHHDVSARRNFAGVLDALARLENAETAFGRIRAAIAAYKDLVDIISHLGVAPHTLSIAYRPPETPWADAALGARFEAMLAAYKAAQFQPVNSPAYWLAVDDAVAHYAGLIAAVQQRVVAGTSPWERRVAGRFLSPQTLAPPVDIQRPRRPH